MKLKFGFLLILLLFCVVILEAKKLSKSRSSSRSSSRRSHSQPAPTSHTAPKPTLFGWQEQPAQRSRTTGSRQNKPTQTHSYPSSQTGLSGKSANPQNTQSGTPQNNGRNINQQTSGHQRSNVNHAYPSSNGMSGSGANYPSQQGGLSGNAPKQPPTYQESVQKSNIYQQNHGYPNSPQSPNQQSHAYPTNHGMSGNSGTGVGYPAHQGHPPQYSNNHYQSGYGNNFNHAPPPPYPGNYGPSYGGYNHGQQMPGYFGNSGRGFGGMRAGTALTGVGIAGAGVGTLLTGLALWNLARSTGHRHHTVIYDNRGQPVAVAPDNSTAIDPILGELVNCTLTISNVNATEVLAIPCAIATSFTPEADVKDTSDVKSNNDATTCTVTVVTKASREFITTIPCSILLNSAAENNVTEPSEMLYGNGTNEYNYGNNMTAYPVVPSYTPIPGYPPISADSNFAAYPPVPAYPPVSDMPTVTTNQTLAQLADIANNNDTSLPNNCTLLEPGVIRDPINLCYAVTSDITVQPLLKDEVSSTTT